MSSWGRCSHFIVHHSQELALGTLMKFVQLEGAHPLEKPKWEGNYLFPRPLFKVKGWWDPNRSYRPEPGWAPGTGGSCMWCSLSCERWEGCQLGGSPWAVCWLLGSAGTLAASLDLCLVSSIPGLPRPGW